MKPSTSGYIQKSRQLSRKGAFAEAIAVLETALAGHPAHPEILFELAMVASQAGMDTTAEKMYRLLLQVSPGRAEVHNNLANCLIRQGRPADARDVLSVALEIDTGVAEIWIALGNTQILTAEYGEAAVSFQRALAIRPGAAGAYGGIADLLVALARYEDAISYFDRAMKHARKQAPRAQLRFNRALALLMAGLLPQGWDDYEARLSAQLRKVKYRPQFKLLKNDNIAGRTLLVLPEQGLGDEIEMASIYPELIERGANLQIATDPRLRAIFARSFPQAEVAGFELSHEGPLRQISIARSAFAKPTQLALAATSLPRLFRRQIEDFPRQGAYLKADPERRAEWRRRLDAAFGGDKALLGFCWRSGKLSGQRHRNYLDLAHYRGLLQRQDCVFVNLQYDISDADLKSLAGEAGVKIENFADLDQWQDLEGVFALIAELDLVISDATMVATVAGALAVPTLRRQLGPFHCGHNPSPFQPSVMSYSGPGHLQRMETALAEFMADWRTTADRASLRRQYAAREPRRIADPGRYEVAVILPD